MRDSLPLLPAALVALFASWSGTLLGGTGGLATVVSHLVLLLVALVAIPNDLDLLGLGGGMRWLPIALWGWLALGCFLSPVSRAGLVVVVLLPAFLALPRLVAVIWMDEASRRRGLAGVVVVVAVVAAWALAGKASGGSERAALPLGHHLLLATWLLALGPLAVALVVRTRRGGRALAFVATGIAGAALAATGAVTAWVGLAVAAVVGLRGRARALAVVLAAVGGLLVGGARWTAFAVGAEASLAARVVYWRGAWRGFLERPVSGWGPGSTPWLIDRWLEPRPGINPAGEVVGDVHSLLLQLLFETGGVGLVLVAMLIVVIVRGQPASAVSDRTVELAARAAVVSALLVLVVVPTLQTSAGWVALAVPLGLLRGSAEAHRRLRPTLAGIVYAVVAAAALVPLDLAQLRYDRARGMVEPAAVQAGLAAATRLDPGFPLYRLRWGLVTEEPGLRAKRLREAALEAGAIGALWLVAGEAGEVAGEAWAKEALGRACRLDPLWAPAPWLLAGHAAKADSAARLAARALLADPRLAASPRWGSLLSVEATREHLRRWPGVDRGWVMEALEMLPGPAPSAGGRTVRLVYELDAEPATALSLHAFRRRPWPSDLVTIPLDESALGAVDLPPAFSLPSTTPEAVPSECPRGAGRE